MIPHILPLPSLRIMSRWSIQLKRATRLWERWCFGIVGSQSDPRLLCGCRTVRWDFFQLCGCGCAHRVNPVDWSTAGAHSTASETSDRRWIGILSRIYRSIGQHSSRAGCRRCGSEVATVSGSVFADFNANQIWDAEEPALADLEVRAQGREFNYSQVIGADGRYRFTELGVGPANFVSELPAHFSPRCQTFKGYLLGETLTEIVFLGRLSSDGRYLTINFGIRSNSW